MILTLENDEYAITLEFEVDEVEDLLYAALDFALAAPEDLGL